MSADAQPVPQATSAPLVTGPELALSPGAAAFLDRVELLMHQLLDQRSGEVVDAARAAVSAGGKRLRPLLVLAATPVEAAEPPGAGSVACAAAVELIHTASLVHDDLLDGASLRRGAPTAHAVHGPAIATAAGDLLLSLAFRALLDQRAALGDKLTLEAVHSTAASARTLAEGEALQQSQMGDVTLTAAEYLLRCDGKTGELFGLAMGLAARIGGGTKADAAHLVSFGRNVGTAFQVADDVLDCFPPRAAAQLGKVPGADLRDRTMTLPILLAAQRDPELATALAAGPPGGVEEALSRIQRTGALEDATAEARGIAAQAVAGLDALADRYDLEALRAVAAVAVERLH